ncbi:hypothetical protein [Pseudochrobactrum saccharolyticum]|uniref:hypothetical protein n=1 Tax=Pseudochrobactrum saccharolyticum TaxID=354352 RepID=UPI00277A2E82|nr:hypothetical protein [Pseudochrobactrum saccharolyticum]MDP8251487.1 hypothetical protein [Pseudochrobactrum saccharolyticum]
MAKTPAEYQRAYRERQKAKEDAKLKQAENSHWYITGDFQTFLTDHPDSDEFKHPLDLMGLEAPEFVDGEPKTATNLSFDLEDKNDAQFYKAMGRADIFVGLLIESTTALARFVNEFKLKEIESRIKEIEAAELTDPAAKKQALKDIVRLNKMRDQLSKQVRITLPQWKVTGE